MLKICQTEQNEDNTVVSEVIIPSRGKRCELPLFLESVSAGFPSPADDYIDQKLDLNDALIRNPAATFFVRVSGDSMIKSGIHSDDILVVDRSLNAKSGSVVIAVIDGELLVKRLLMENGKVFLIPENNDYQTIEIKDEMAFEIWGVVTTVIHSLV